MNNIKFGTYIVKNLR